MEFAVESLETPALTKAQLAELLFDQIESAVRAVVERIASQLGGRLRG